jgi:hypothetical protein
MHAPIAATNELARAPSKLISRRARAAANARAISRSCAGVVRGIGSLFRWCWFSDFPVATVAKGGIAEFRDLFAGARRVTVAGVRAKCFGEQVKERCFAESSEDLGIRVTDVR